MSLEQIVGIAILLLLPLVQYLKDRIVPGHDAGTDDPGTRDTRDVGNGDARNRRRPPHEALPVLAPLPATPAAAPRGRPPLPERPQDRTIRRSRPPGLPAAKRRDQGELRKGIVLMTLIGPCLADRPHDVPYPAQR